MGRRCAHRRRLTACATIAEVDLNPLIVGEEGAWAVDVRIVAG